MDTIVLSDSKSCDEAWRGYCSCTCTVFYDIYTCVYVFDISVQLLYGPNVKLSRYCGFIFGALSLHTCHYTLGFIKICVESSHFESDFSTSLQSLGY